MTDLYAARWRGQPGRLEVWYATLTDPDSGLGLWIHHELVARTDGSTKLHGWATAFVPGERPVSARFGPVDVAAVDASHLADPDGPGEVTGGEDLASRAYVQMGVVSAGPDRLQGEAGALRWRLQVRNGGEPLFPFPRWSWRNELLPAAQVVPSPTATFSGEVRVGDRVFRLGEAGGAVSRIYGHGNASRWGWLHADLGGGDVLELVAAVSARPGLRHLPPLPLLQLRAGGRDWPRSPLLAAPLLRARLDQPEWSVWGVVGRRRVRIHVVQDPGDSVTMQYENPDGRGPVCVNSERASAEVLVERWSGSWAVEYHWHLDHTAHAEIGFTTPHQNTSPGSSLKGQPCP